MLDVSATTVHNWIGRDGLKTPPPQYVQGHPDIGVPYWNEFGREQWRVWYTRYKYLRTNLYKAS